MWAYVYYSCKQAEFIGCISTMQVFEKWKKRVKKVNLTKKLWLNGLESYTKEETVQFNELIYYLAWTWLELGALANIYKFYQVTK